MKNQENRFAKSSSEAINKPLPAAAMSEDIMFLVDRLSSNFTVALEASLLAANSIFLGRAVRRAATLFLLGTSGHFFLFEPYHDLVKERFMIL